MTREITMIVVHSSATRCNHPYTVHQLYHDHVEVNHWRYIGYHFFISRDGKVHATRPLERMGAHARGWNAHSIGICYEGGLDDWGIVTCLGCRRRVPVLMPLRCSPCYI